MLCLHIVRATREPGPSVDRSAVARMNDPASAACLPGRHLAFRWRSPSLTKRPSFRNCCGGRWRSWMRLPGGPHEIVIVDDGSTDRSPQLLQQAVERGAATDGRSSVAKLRSSSGAGRGLGARHGRRRGADGRRPARRPGVHPGIRARISTGQRRGVRDSTRDAKSPSGCGPATARFIG